VTVVAAPPPSVNVPDAGDAIVEPLVGLVIETVGGSTTVKVAVCVAEPPTLLAVTLNVCVPAASAGLVCGLVHGLITVRASHWQVTVVAVPPPSVKAPVAGEATVPVGLEMLTVGGATTVNVLVTLVVAATLVALTVNVCTPAARVIGPCGLVHGLITGCESHWQVTVVAPVVVKFAVCGEPTVLPLAGAVMFTVGGSTMLNVFVAVAVPATLDAVTLNVCEPAANAWLFCGLEHGLITVSESHWQDTVVAAPPPSVKTPLTGDPKVPAFAGELIDTVGATTTVKFTVCEVVPTALVALTVNECGPAASAGLVCGLVHELITVRASHWQVTEVAPLVVKTPLAGDATLLALTGEVMLTLGTFWTLNVRTTVDEPARLLPVTVNVWLPTASAGLVCGLVHGLITVNASH
jgi:hypothetical protein